MTGRLDSDPRRDATPSIRGYVYQAYQSVSAWMHLAPDDQLFLEAAEDFDVQSSGETTATQVKDRAGRSVTLRSAEAVEAMHNFWEHLRRNQQRRIRLRFLTTAERGRETGTPLDRGGIEYWEAAAAGNAQVGPLRAFLLTLPLTASVRAFIETGTDEALRRELLSRIEWDTGNRPLDGLRAALEDDLISYGDRFAVPATESARVLGTLLAAVADVLSSGGERRLTYAEFCRTFESATMVSVPRGQAVALRAAIGSPQLAELTRPFASGTVFEPPQLLVRGAVPRKKLVDDLAAALRSNGALVLWGSTGVGKTSIASLVTARFDEEFVWAGFRGQVPSLVGQRLGAAASQLRQSGLTPRVVLDDLELGSTAKFEREFLSLVFQVRRLRGLLVITGYNPCSEELLDKSWLPAASNRQIPYLDEADIAELLATSGAPAGQYIATQAKAIAAATGGHPQLVHARARRLASEKWPPLRAETLFSDGGVASVKVEARRRLMEELPDDRDTRILAYRLSAAIGSFTRGHALAVADVAPHVSTPGERLDLLVGPWLERLGADAFRVSPLLGNAASETLAAAEVQAVNEALALHPFRKKRIAASEIGTALLHAFLARSRVALAQCAQLLMHTNLESVPGLAESLFPVPAMALEQGQRLFDEDAALDVMLRVVQFKIASATGQNEAAISSIDRAMEVFPEVEPELRRHIEALAYTAFLMNITVPIPPSRTIPMLAAFMAMPEHDPELAELVRNYSSKPGPSGTAPTAQTPFQSLFQFEAARMDSIGSLDSFLTEMSRLPDEDRRHLLSVCRDEMLASLLVNNAWHRDAQRQRLDPDRAVTVAERALSCGLEWGAREFARAASIAIAVLHDEYRHDAAAALAALDRAASHFGEADGRILVGRGKVLYGKKAWAAAVTAFEAGLRDATIDGVDRVFGTRLLGMSAANTGDWTRAGGAFLEASSVARSHHMRLVQMAVGLKADAAFAMWKRGDVAGALRLYAEVLTELAGIPVDRDLRNRHLHATVRHGIVWVWAFESERRPPEMAEPPPGMCSNQEPHEGMADFEIRDVDAVWNLLAATDDRAGAGLGLAATARARSSGPAPLIVQAAERSSALDALRSGRRLPDAARIIIRVLESVVAQRDAAAKGAAWEKKEIGHLPADYWDDVARRSHLRRLLIAVGVIAAAEGLSPLPTDAWMEPLRKAGALRDDVARTIALMNDGEEPAGEDMFEHAAAAAGRLRSRELLPRELFKCHFRLLNALEGGDPEYLGGEALARLAGAWCAVAQNQRFSLADPNVNCPVIEERCSESTRSGLRKVAAILDAAAPAAGVRLDANARSFLRRLMSAERPDAPPTRGE